MGDGNTFMTHSPPFPYREIRAVRATFLLGCGSNSPDFPVGKSGLLEQHSYLVVAESGWALDPFTQNLWMLLSEPGKLARRIVGLLWVVFPTVLIQFRSVAQLCPNGLQHNRPPCPSPTPRACSNSCPLSQ